MSTYDLTSAAGVLAYLDAKHPSYSGTHAQPLSGGNANFVFRIFLSHGFDIDGAKQSTIILKHAAPYSASSEEFSLPVERQGYEVAALRYADKFCEAGSLARPPTVLEYDVENRAVLMSDAGPGSQTLKALLLANALPASAAAQLGTALGEFISKLHEHGRKAPERVEFAKNQWAREISLWLTHGRVLEFLATGILDPPLELSEAQRTLVKASVEHMENLFLNSEETTLMGDFWTGNILVQLTGGREQVLERAIVVDWEVSKLGTPGNDLGQFAAEVYLPMTFIPTCAPAASALIEAFCAAYKSGIRELGKDTLFNASKQLGSHLLTVAPSYPPWNTDQTKLRVAVNDGISYLSGDIPAVLRGLD